MRCGVRTLELVGWKRGNFKFEVFFPFFFFFPNQRQKKFSQPKPEKQKKMAKRITTQPDEGSIKKQKVTSPKDAYFQSLEQVQTREGCIGQMLVTGIDDDCNPEKLTKADCAKLRFVLINQSRADLLDSYEDLVLGDQAHDSVMMFNTSFSYTVIPLILRTARKKFKTSALSFDNLFAFSQTILQNDYWAHDNEDSQECCEATNALGKAWKKLLKKTDAELGIDKGEFFLVFYFVPDLLRQTCI